MKPTIDHHCLLMMSLHNILRLEVGAVAEQPTVALDAHGQRAGAQRHDPKQIGLLRFRVSVLMGLMIYFINREYIMRLFTDPLGIRFLVAGILLQVTGYFVIRKIIQPKF